MPDKSPIGNVIRNTLLVRRFESGLAQQSDDLLRALFNDMAGQMQRNASTIMAWEPLARNTARNRAMQGFLNEIDSAIGSTLNDIRGIDAQGLTALFDNQAHYAEQLLTQQIGAVAVDILPTRVSPFMAKAVVELHPFQGHTLGQWFDNLEYATGQRVIQQIQLGVLQNETIDDIVRRIRGRAVEPFSQVFKGGVLTTTTRNARAIVRTAVTDVATQAHLELFKANSDITSEFEYLATLDTRTTEICASLDGQRFAYTDPDAKFPPQHVGCRSAIIPVVDWESLGITPPPEGMRASMDGPVSADTNMEGWLKDQPLERQQAVLGKAKGQMFRDGQIKLNDLIRKEGGVVTLAELQGKTVAREVKRQARKAGKPVSEVVGSSSLTDDQALTMRRWEHEHRNASYNGDVLFTDPIDGRRRWLEAEGRGLLTQRYRDDALMPFIGKDSIISVVNDTTWHRVADWNHFAFAEAMDASELRILHRGQVTRVLRPTGGWPSFEDDARWFDQFFATQRRHAADVNAAIRSGTLKPTSKNMAERLIHERTMKEFADQLDATVITDKWKRAWTDQVEAVTVRETSAAAAAVESAKKKAVAEMGAGWEQALEEAIPDFKPAGSLRAAEEYAQKHFAYDARYVAQNWTLEQANQMNQVLARDLGPLGIRLRTVGTGNMGGNTAAFYERQADGIRNKVGQEWNRLWKLNRTQPNTALLRQELMKEPWDEIRFKRSTIERAHTWPQRMEEFIPEADRVKRAFVFDADLAALRGELGDNMKGLAMSKWGIDDLEDAYGQLMMKQIESNAAVARWDNGIGNVHWLAEGADNVATVAHHEAGHAVQWRGVDAGGMPLTKRFKAELYKRGIMTFNAPETYGVSRYAQKNFRELWAETWAQIRMGNRDMIPQAIQDALDACMAVWRPSPNFGLDAG